MIVKRRRREIYKNCVYFNMIVFGVFWEYYFFRRNVENMNCIFRIKIVNKSIIKNIWDYLQVS